MWPALRTLGNCVALSIAMTLALAAARNDSGDHTTTPATNTMALPPQLEALGNSMTDARPLSPALVAVLKTWVEPTEPVKIVGPIYYVGTHGLGAYLITTPAGHILPDGGMPSATEDIEASIRKLGFQAEDIRLLLMTHAHVDHVGTTAYFKRLSDATLAVMAREVENMRSGGKTDPTFGSAPAFYFPP